MIQVQKAWSRRKPKVSQLKVFGSFGYAHVDDLVRIKLNDKTKKDDFCEL